jgi:hypothetical protein
MRVRQQGLPADEFLSPQARSEFEGHARGGLWLHDDTLPGGPGGEYRDFSIDGARKLSWGGWHVFVEIEVAWDGDVPPSDIGERLTIGIGAGEKLLVLEARRIGDWVDNHLPTEVAMTRERIYRAAIAQDYEALAALVDPQTFNYSLGEEGDPVGYWRRQEKAEIPVLGDVLPTILHTRFGMKDDIYVWPSATSKLPSEWTEADIESMREAGYTDRDIRAFEEQIGGYAGWRVGIRADGTWLYFISGD